MTRTGFQEFCASYTAGNTMTPELAKACAAFLMRVQMSGQEVETFLAVQRALVEIINGKDSSDNSNTE